ncbi:HNH endonuclease family protein [Spiroplasma endosymbiont of Acasis viretata]|uniref:HNH endonuclease family protein n=1 Tax=Spiroplasma endosymbiont of Acasis viretata TaxID=3066306 RepID=UPI00313C951F
MQIRELRLTIKELVENYSNNEEDGVIGWNNKLNIRPAYQREFVYKEKERNAVIKTVLDGFPLNVMYFAKTNDNQFEVMDGQQRIISICEFLANNFSLDNRGIYFYSLPKDVQQKVLNYELIIYECVGKNSEILDWFRVINIAGVVLTQQELRNVSYTGSWLNSAKKYFSKTNCPAIIIAKNFITGIPNRQEILELALKWIIKSTNDKSIEEYMGKHMLDKNANELWEYFNKVINWVQKTFLIIRKQMKNVDWNELFLNFKDTKINVDNLELEIKNLMSDEEVLNKVGIYKYVLTRNESYLNLRTFNESQKTTMFELQNGKCNICKNTFSIEEVEADHIDPWSQGGKTIIENCQILCKTCNRRKSNK